jgi:hypothetical protein
MSLFIETKTRINTMKIIAQKIFMTLAIVSAAALVTPSTAVFAKDKKQCAAGEKWDKRQNRCVDANSY